jgi:hypothetical protein
MQQRSPSMWRRLPPLLLLLLAALPLLAAPARACSGGGHGAAPRWEREVEFKGRKRSLLSMEGRRYVSGGGS